MYVPVFLHVLHACANMWVGGWLLCTALLASAETAGPARLDKLGRLGKGSDVACPAGDGQLLSRPVSPSPPPGAKPQAECGRVHTAPRAGREAAAL